mmetsp:Transcript_30552/g.56925  ORF Transcript_30552/g.56925 Transcript_30552/m.56925 type:complete len:584 (+) Transcript_30552:94-1845(+)
MIKALLFSAFAASAAAHKKGPKGDSGMPEAVVNMCNSTCLTLEAIDFYGDGWDSVELHSEEEGGMSMSMAPDCMNNKVRTQICPDSDGTYYFTAVHSNASYIPENYWEIFWTASTHNCDGTVANMYTGGFNSSLIMDYVGNEWSVQYWENLWDNEKNCDACGDAKRCKPKKPKGKGKGGKGKPGKGGDDDKGGSGGNDDDGKPYAGMNTTMTNTTKVPKAKPRYGPPAVNLRVTMYDEMGDGWWKNDYSGESWYLADDRREKLFHTGTLCDGSMGSCDLCLGDGSYTMRFTGDASNFTAWDFCGVTGQRAQELTFHVLKGACYADSIVSLETECTGTVETDVTMTGVVAVSGFPSEVVSEGSSIVLAKTVASMINGWSEDKIKVVSTSLDAVSSSSRRLADFTQDFTFEVEFISETAFGVDGRSYSNLQSLASTLYTTLSNKMSSGQFEASLQVALALNNVVSLSPSSTAELVSLEVGKVSFTGTERAVVSTLPAIDYSTYEESVTVSKYNVEATVFFGVAVVGFVAFVGIMRKGMSTEEYETLADDSERAVDVRESEMETSTSPMVKQAFEVDATPTSSLKL